MKKKILVLIFILALSVCLAFASSASNYFDISNFSDPIGKYGSIDFYYAGNIPVYNGEKLGIIVLTGVDYQLGFINIEGWHNLIVTNDITDHITLKEYVLNLCGNDSYVSMCFYDYSEKFWSVYCDYVSILNKKTYYDGVKDGINQAHEFTNNWLEENHILSSTVEATGELTALESLLDSNVLTSLDNSYSNGYSVGYDEGMHDFNTHTSHIIEQYTDYCSISSIEQSLSSFEEYVSANFSQYLTYYNLGVNELAELMYSVSSGGSGYSDGYSQGKIDGVTEFKTTEEYKSQYTTGYSDGYSQGKIDGVTEFKTTEEYKSQYTTGYTNGIAEFKASDVYCETLLIERQTGQAEGKDMFMASQEYKAALNKEYNNGYNTATTEQEQKQMKNNLGVILGTCLVIVFVLSVVYLAVSRKKHKRR
ncbi:MAG: hypothetical protein J6A95_01790 [Clostridia bacterium]|nr:hypothetical protein [Clostridia bacterium]